MAIVSQATTFEGCGLRDLTPDGSNFTRNFLLKRNFFCGLGTGQPRTIPAHDHLYKSCECIVICHNTTCL